MEIKLEIAFWAAVTNANILAHSNEVVSAIWLASAVILLTIIFWTGFKNRKSPK
jgi:hypothetical protein